MNGKDALGFEVADMQVAFVNSSEPQAHEKVLVGTMEGYVHTEGCILEQGLRLKDKETEVVVEKATSLV